MYAAQRRMNDEEAEKTFAQYMRMAQTCSVCDRFIKSADQISEVCDSEVCDSC